MSDDAQTLLSRATPRRTNGDPIENEMTFVNSDVLLAAFDEIERLRARVDALETALRYYAEDNYNGYNATGACARAALEDKP